MHRSTSGKHPLDRPWPQPLPVNFHGIPRKQERPSNQAVYLHRLLPPAQHKPPLQQKRSDREEAASSARGSSLPEAPASSFELGTLEIYPMSSAKTGAVCPGWKGRQSPWRSTARCVIVPKHYHTYWATCPLELCQPARHDISTDPLPSGFLSAATIN